MLARLVCGGALVSLPACTVVPELGGLVDRGGGKRKIVVDLGDQKAFLYRDGEVIAQSRVSSGKKGYRTPTGRFRVTQKDIDHRSSVYGIYVKNGKVIKADVDTKKDRRPPGARYIGASMPHFLRVNGAIGMHGGKVPGYPASHGCIRLPPRHARRFYEAVEVGTPVLIRR